LIDALSAAKHATKLFTFGLQKHDRDKRDAEQNLGDTQKNVHIGHDYRPVRLAVEDRARSMMPG